MDLGNLNPIYERLINKPDVQQTRGRVNAVAIGLGAKGQWRLDLDHMFGIRVNFQGQIFTLDQNKDNKDFSLTLSQSKRDSVYIHLREYIHLDLETRGAFI